MRVIPALKKRRHKGQEFKVILGYTVSLGYMRPCLNADKQTILILHLSPYLLSPSL